MLSMLTAALRRPVAASQLSQTRDFSKYLSKSATKRLPFTTKKAKKG